MLTNTTGIRPFLGAKDFDESRAFYGDLGFQELEISPEMSVFRLGETSFYLQRYYVKDWVDNSMIFLEVEDLDAQLEAIVGSGIVDRYAAFALARSMTTTGDASSSCTTHRAFYGT
ncbi:MAG: hypothetical protein Aurels2KO_28230 [Aureliella sp.]